jgi:hypothetical protein
LNYESSLFKENGYALLGGLSAVDLTETAESISKLSFNSSEEARSLLRDEKGKIPLARRGCLLIIIGSGLGGSSLPQNLGIGQKVVDRTP